MDAVPQLLRRFHTCRAGATGAEYAIFVGLLVVVVIAAISALGGVTRVAGEVSGAISQQSPDGPSASSYLTILRTD